jgi:predicted  nucleic acid-binding Zn-ribbon protein
MDELKKLGHVENESQTGEEVTQKYTDLDARLTNARNSEKRLSDILRDRTGKLSDVLAVEEEIQRVRGEIEQMDAQLKSLSNRVDFATLNLTVREDYKAQLNLVPESTSTRFRNAAVNGYHTMLETVIAITLWILSSGPTLLLWMAAMFFPARWAWRRWRTN